MHPLRLKGNPALYIETLFESFSTCVIFPVYRRELSRFTFLPAMRDEARMLDEVASAFSGPLPEEAA